MLAIVLAISISQSLLTPQTIDQDFLHTPVPPKSCAAIRTEYLQNIANGLTLYGQVNNGGIIGCIGGTFDDLINGQNWKDIIKRGLFRPLIDLLPAEMKAPCR